MNSEYYSHASETTLGRIKIFILPKLRSAITILVYVAGTTVKEFAKRAYRQIRGKSA